MTEYAGLIADVGGTNARFALCGEDGRPAVSETVLCRDYTRIEEAVADFLKKNGGARVKAAAFAVASPVLDDIVSMTNCDWVFSISALKKELGLDRLKVVNDFVAQALAVPLLSENEKIKIGGGEPRDRAPLVVVGPGTGLGVSILVPDDAGGWIALPGEGGHATMPAPFPEEERVISALRQEYGHVSAERVISGAGLANLHRTLLALRREKADEPLAPEEISARALAGDALCREAVQMMFGLLGTFAGNLALTAGAFGGVYIAGGIVPRPGLIDLFRESAFRVRFEAKGRFAAYLSRIPTYVMTAEYPAFSGLASLLEKK